MSYMTRALKSRNPRYARILSKLGYTPECRHPMTDDACGVMQEPDDIAAVRAEYEAVIGRRPFMGWDIETLRAKIATAKAGD